jgi:hypothetical protein
MRQGAPQNNALKERPGKVVTTSGGRPRRGSG